MKSVVAMNEGYFRDKITVKNNAKPCNLRLKLPFKTSNTTYKKDYIKNSKSAYNLKRTAN